MKTIEERLWAKVDKSGECWIWTGANRNGTYGVIRHNGRSEPTHRVTYELANGPIPEGMDIDHMCHVSLCCRPEHLQAVTHKQNAENRAGARKGSKSGVRGVMWSKASKKWHAQVGHNYRKYHAGFFDTIEEAEAAVIAKRNELYTNNLADRSAA
jgi:hypothetical protein